MAGFPPDYWLVYLAPLESTKGEVCILPSDGIRVPGVTSGNPIQHLFLLTWLRSRIFPFSLIHSYLMASVPFPIPKPGEDGATILRSLGTSFNLVEHVVDALIKAKIENLAEFRFFFEDESKVEPWLGKLTLGEDKNIQAARLRRAWAAVRLFYQQAEQDRSKVLTSDLDTMLGDTELRTAKQSFWRRYKLRFPAEVHPADATVSRVSREMDKRMLCVYNVWKVKSLLQFQLHTSQKKRRLADGLYVDEMEEDDIPGNDADSYLDRLHTLMIAYAIAGAQALAGAPTIAEDLGADSTRYVAVPLDVMLSYFLRAKRTTMQIPLGRRLAWLQARDAEERAEWVTRFRESALPLGQIVKEVFAARDAHWLPSTAVHSEPAGSQAALGGGGSPPVKTVGASLFSLGKSINGRKVARTMKDGTKLCAAFQHGQCKQKSPCSGGHHRCGLVVRGERTCGSPGHGAAACRASTKP